MTAKKKESLWQRLERLQVLYKWSGRELAMKAGVSHQAVNRAKRRSKEDPDATLTADVANAIARVTKCDPWWLMKGDGDWGINVIIQSTHEREVEEGREIERTLSSDARQAPTVPPKRLRRR